jgi:glycosyltransferase involved in cell wall biosynthesis
VLAAASACQRSKVPYIISPRGTIYPETIALKSARLKKTYYQLLARRYLIRAAAIHFTAEDEREKVMNYLRLSSPSLVIPNGIDLEEYSFDGKLLNGECLPAELGRKQYILFLGRIHPKKGLDLLIEAFSSLQQGHPELYLVLAGPDRDGYGKVIEQQIARKQIGDRVIFTGMLTGEVKQAVLKRATVFVLPSYSENFGMSVVEAMAAGTPVVISNAVGISAEIDGNRAGIVTQTTPESVAMGILQVLQDRTRRSEIIANGRRMVSDYFDIRAVASSFKKAYEDISR